MLTKIASVVAVRGFAAAIQAVLLIWVARELGPSDFGVFSVVLAVGAVTGALLGLGSTSQALRLGDSEADRAVLSALLLIRLLTASIAALIGMSLAVLSALDPLHSVVAMVWIWSEMQTELVQSALFGQARVRSASISILLRRVLPIVGALGFMAAGSSLWIGLLVGMLISTVVSVALVCGLLTRPASLKSVLVESRYYWLSTALIGLQASDVVVVGAVAGPGPLVGYYSAASRVTSPLNLVTQSILSLLTPRLAREGRSDRWHSFRAARRGLWVVAALLALASPLVGTAGQWVLGSGYEGSGALFVGVTVAAGVSAVAQGYASYLYASGAAKELTVARLWTIPLGLTALAFAALTGEVLVLALGPVLIQGLQLLAMHRCLRAVRSKDT